EDHRGGHRPARLRHRRGVPHRLRLSAVSRRPHAQRRLARPLQRGALHAPALQEPPRRSQGMGTCAAARQARCRREIVQWERAMSDAAIVSTARTGLAKSWRGALNMTHGATLGAHVVRAAVERAKIDPAEVEDVIMGCALPEGTTGGNVARQIALRAGLPGTTAGT